MATRWRTTPALAQIDTDRRLLESDRPDNYETKKIKIKK